MRKSILLALSLAAGIFTNASASDFFNTGAPETLFNIGVRAGINTSNMNVNKNVFDTWNCNSWGTGVDLGVVADINFKDYLSIQPGFFYESRSGKYAYVSRDAVTPEGTDYLTQFGKIRDYNFLVPIMACVHFNLGSEVRWNLEFGPYFQFVLKNKLDSDAVYPLYQVQDALPVGYKEITPTKFDFGFKFGTSLKVLQHYLIGVHYQAGVLKPWSEGALGGRRKAWVFSVGYDF